MTNENEEKKTESFPAKIIGIGNSIGIIIPDRFVLWNNLQKGDELRIFFEKKKPDEL